MNPLDQLQDIHLPEQVSAWPPAYGWWLLLVLAMLLLFGVFVLIRNKRRHNRARKTAILQLKQMDKNHNEWESDINALLKRVCVSYFPSENAAGLYGSDWIQFLAEKLPEKTREPFLATMTEWQNQLYRSPNHTAEQSTTPPAFEQVQAQALLWLQRFNSKTHPEASHV